MRKANNFSETILYFLEENAVTKKTPKVPKPIRLYIPTEVHSRTEYDLAFLSTLLALRLSAETGADFIVNDKYSKPAFDLSKGICAGLDVLSGEITLNYRTQEDFYDIFGISLPVRKWKKFSGSTAFPINEKSFGKVSTSTQFLIVKHSRTYSEPEYTEPRKKYLALRLELLDFLIDYTKRSLDIA